MDDNTIDRPVLHSQLETLLSEGDTPADSLAPDESEDPSHIGRFVVLRRVGEGGMGVVYAAYDNELERRVAIKVVHLARVKGRGSRIKREAQALARLSHPNVVQVYEVVSHAEQLSVVMEFVTGPTLAQWATEQLPSSTRWRTILTTYIDVGRGLAAAHAARIVHRDFKPANAIVGDDGRVRVLDFGIARAADGPGGDSEQSGPLSEDDLNVLDSHALDETLARSEPGPGDFDPLATPLTMTGALMGTPAYMSPEQFERRKLGPASDQFSFCVALWEALYGERPFRGENPAALMIAVLAGKRSPPPSQAEVPSWVRDILARGLATHPDARWPSMSALLDALGRDPARRRRRRLRQAGTATLLVAVIAGSAWFARTQQREADAAERESLDAREQERLARERKATAETERDAALREAQATASSARDTARVLAAHDFDAQPALAAALLREVENPAQTTGWAAAALEALQRPTASHLLEDHEGRVVYLDVSPRNDWLATAAFDKTARLWRPGGGPSVLLPHPDHVFQASFDRTGERLVTACRDGLARVWTVPKADTTLTTLTPSLVLHGQDDVLWSAQFSHAGDKVAAPSRSGMVALWDLDAPEHPTLLELGNIVWWAEFSPHDTWLAAGSASGAARVWSLANPERPPIDLVGATGSVGDLHFGPRGRIIAAASADGHARLYRLPPDTDTDTDTLTDTDTVTTLEPYAVLDHDKNIVRVRFSPGGLRLGTISRDGTAKVWTLDEEGKLEGPPMHIHTGSTTVWTGDFSPDGRTLALGLTGGKIQLWPLEGGPPVELIGHIADTFRVRYSRDGQTLYSASHDSTARVWSMDLHAIGRVLPGHTGTVTSLEVENSLLVSSDLDGLVQLWSVMDPGTSPVVTRAPTTLSGYQGRTSAALDDFPRLLAVGSEHNANVQVWRVTSDRILARDQDQALLELELPDQTGVRSLAFDGRGELLAVASTDGNIYLWRLGSEPGEAEREPMLLAQHPTDFVAVTRVRFSPDGLRLASAGGDTIINLWSTAELRRAELGSPPQPRQLLGHSNRIYDIRFSPDNTKLASASSDYSTRIWDLSTAQTSSPALLDHNAMVINTAFHPTRALVATACANTRTYLWDLAAPEQPLRSFSAAAGEVRDVEFSPDGELLAAVSHDGHLRVWPLDGGDVFEFDTGSPLNMLRFFDQGRRIAVAGEGNVALVYLGGSIDPENLQTRLRETTRACLSPQLRMRFVGESNETALANHAACRALAEK